MRLLSGGRLHHDLLVVPEPTLVGERLIGAPRLQDHRQGLVKARLCLLRRHAEAGELGVPVALSDTEVKTPIGEKIEGRRAFGQQHRVMPGQHEHRGPHPYRRRACGHPAQEIEGGRDLTGAGEVVLDQERRVEPEAFGFELVSMYSESRDLGRLPSYVAPKRRRKGRSAWLRSLYRSRLRSRSVCGLEGAVKSGRCGGSDLGLPRDGPGSYEESPRLVDLDAARRSSPVRRSRRLLCPPVRGTR